MAYSKQNFQNGQILNAANLEAMENGIIAGQGAHNLLDNSDFTNPVNSRGKNTYSDGGNEYTIDRWKTQYGTNISIENGYINIFGNWDLKQRLKKPLGIIYTLAAKVRINSTGDHTPAMGIDGGQKVEFDAPIGEWRIYTKQIDISSITDETIEIQLAPNGGSSSGSISVEWVALYEGSYDVNTLPPYISKGRHIEMLNCNVPLASHNLLDNSDFRDPVNQRGKTSYGGGEYTIDRWKNQIDTNMAIMDGFIRITGSWDARQILGKKLIGTYTFAVYAKVNVAGEYIQTIEVFENGSSIASSMCTGVGEWKIYTCTATFTGGTNQFVIINNRAGNISDASMDVQWAALYEGAYDASTLPPYVPKGKHVEMLNCGVPLAPHNLLDNSDFTNPVNQRGAKTATLGKYFIDRWGTEPFPSGPSITIDSNGLTLLPTTNSTAGIYQQLPDYENRKGKVYTFAICVDNVWKCVSFTMGNFGVGYLIHGLYFFSVDNRNILIRNNTSDNPTPITIQRVALYEGSYTADTLPSYVPKGKHVEMLNCGVPLQPHNLLDNSDFRNPVNQRGIASGAVITGWDYFIDRWQARAENCSVNFSGEGITASTPIGQILPKETVKNGMTVTAAAKWSDGTICVASGAIRRTNEWGSFSSANINGHSLYVSDEGDGNHACITISEGTVVWAALYEGAYDASTLPAYQPKGYAAELAECQRYYLPLNNQLLGSGYTFSNGAALLVPRKMRIDAPSFVSDGTIRARVNGADYTLTLSYVTTYGSMIKVDFACDNIPMNYPCAFYSEASSVSLNANL